LTPDEYDVLVRRFGFSGPPESMKDLARHRGCTHAEATEVLGRAIEKMRTRLAPG
jgi:hypothetical protein